MIIVTFFLFQLRRQKTQYAIITEMQARFLEMTSKYQEEEERRQRRGYVEEEMETDVDKETDKRRQIQTDNILKEAA